MDTYRLQALLGSTKKEEKPSYGDLSIGLNPLERCEMAMIKLFVPDANTSGVPEFKGLAEAYLHFTGDSDISGYYKADRVSKDLRSCQDFNSASFSHALQNAMNVYLSKAYKAFPYHEEALISQRLKVTDFRKISSIQLGYYSDLPDIDPEAADYHSMTPYADGEAKYELSQKGAVIWVTRKHVVNDNIEAVKGMVERAARAARRTHAKYVWSFFINNALCPDGTAWFTDGHGNLGAALLDIESVGAAITALANMTEPGPSMEKLGLDLQTFNWKLVAPIGLWKTAVKVNQSDSTFIEDDLSTKETNPCHQLFGARNEGIITCPFMTEPNDWGIIRDREDVPIVEMSYLNGREEPEIIAGWTPKVEGMFVFNNDKLGYKVRHEYGGALADYRGGYKSVIA